DEWARGRGSRRRREEPAGPDRWSREEPAGPDRWGREEPAGPDRWSREEPRGYRDEPDRRFSGEPDDGTPAGRPPGPDDTMPGRGGLPPVAAQPLWPEAGGPAAERRQAGRRGPATETDPGRRRVRQDDQPAGQPARDQPPVPPARRLVSLAV